MESRGRLRQPMSACGNLVLGWPLSSPPQLPPVGALPAAASILGQGRCLRERNDLALAFPPRLTYTSTGDHREVCPCQGVEPGTPDLRVEQPQVCGKQDPVC